MFTIGYERSTLSDFVATLQMSGIDVLADIRDRAQSRRPGFSKSALSEALSKANIQYVHLKELGDPKEGREAARRGDFGEFRRVFSNVMASEEANSAVQQIAEMLKDSNVCLMCYERDVKTCHRKIVSDNLKERTGTPVKHLGVADGASIRTGIRRVHDTHQGATASI
ncbi:MAG: hypothetical protein C0486_08450 [Erythrobacter sp.]|nr:hypothetical protein [Erythrobacter sp.]MBA4081507.1 hypothetical protein [Erythrobacter sp.]